MCTGCAIVLDCEYIACMFKAMCTTTFYVFMRIGVITASKQAPNVIQLSQVTKLSNASGFIASVKLTFHQFKHHYTQPPISIIISRQAGYLPCGKPFEIFYNVWLSARAPI